VPRSASPRPGLWEGLGRSPLAKLEPYWNLGSDSGRCRAPRNGPDHPDDGRARERRKPRGHGAFGPSAMVLSPPPSADSGGPIRLSERQSHRRELSVAGASPSTDRNAMPIRAMRSITQPERASRSWPGHRRQHRQRPRPRTAVRGHRLVVGLGRRGVRRDELDGIAGSHAHRRSSTGSGPSAISAPVPTRSPIRAFERRGHRAVLQRRGVETRQGRPAARAGTWMTTRAAQRRPLRGSERRADIECWAQP
jgi:hypothetical protein